MNEKDRLISAVCAWLIQHGMPIRIHDARQLRDPFLGRGVRASWVASFGVPRQGEDEFDGTQMARLDLLSSGEYRIETSIAASAEDWICGLDSHCSPWWHKALECRGGRPCTPMPEPYSYLDSGRGHVFNYPPKCWPMTLEVRDGIT